MATSNQDDLDPSRARTPEEFMQLLRQARAASGLSIVEIAERARQRGYDLDPVTLARDLDLLPTLPPWQTVTGVLTACGLGGMAIDRWMRVYHDLAAPAQPVAAPPAETAVQEPLDVEPVIVPPLVLATAPATPSRLGPKHFAIAASVLAALIVVPLMLFNLFGSEPDTVAGDQTVPAPRTSQAEPQPSATDEPVVLPSPTEPAAPTTPAPVTTTAKPPVRTSAPPAPLPPPPPPPPADPGVLRSGVVALIGNQGFDLDTGQTEGEPDFYRFNSDTLARSNGSQLADVPGTPTKQSCDALSNRDWDNWVDNLAVGEWLCVHTSERRLARLNITAVGNTLKVAYTVWS
ncbi:helix-turn-helix domain-containing protein [Rhizocola hellebori]|nr:helix-turn-helix transcriptional regulator [Rhizocola hellebori]